MNAKEIKERVSIMQVADMLGLKGEKKDNEWRYPCPACPSDNKRKLTITPHWQNKDGSLGSFKCWHSQTYGDLFALVCHVNGVRFKDALTEVAEHFGIEDSGPARRPSAPEPKGSQPEGPVNGPTSSNSLAKVREYLQFEHPVIQALGLTSEQAQAIGVGYKPKGMFARSIVFPLYKDAELVGYAAIGEDGGLRFPNNLADVL